MRTHKNKFYFQSQMIKLENHKRILLNRLIVFIVFVEYTTYFSFLSNIWLVDKLSLWAHNYKIFLKMIYCTLRTLFLLKPHHFGAEPTRIFILFHQFILLHCGNLFNAFLLGEYVINFLFNLKNFGISELDS